MTENQTMSKDEQELVENFRGLTPENQANLLARVRVALAAQENTERALREERAMNKENLDELTIDLTADEVKKIRELYQRDKGKHNAKTFDEFVLHLMELGLENLEMKMAATGRGKS